MLSAPTGRDEMQAPDLQVLLDKMIACGREFERTVAAGEALSVRQHDDGAGRDSSRHAPAVSVRRRRRLLRRFGVWRPVRVPPFRRGRPAAAMGNRRNRESIGSDNGRWLAERMVRPTGSVSELLGTLPLWRRLPLRGYSPRPARLRLHSWLARLCLGCVYQTLSAAARYVLT